MQMQMQIYNKKVKKCKTKLQVTREKWGLKQNKAVQNGSKIFSGSSLSFQRMKCKHFCQEMPKNETKMHKENVTSTGKKPFQKMRKKRIHHVKNAKWPKMQKKKMHLPIYPPPDGMEEWKNTETCARGLCQQRFRV